MQNLNRDMTSEAFAADLTTNNKPRPTQVSARSAAKRKQNYSTSTIAIVYNVKHVSNS